MIVWRQGRVCRVTGGWRGALELEVELEVESGDGAGGRICRALAYPELVGRPEVDDLVLLNTSALDAGLGTGGYALVVAVPGRLPSTKDDASGDDVSADGADSAAGAPTAGHLVKGRYGPMQVSVLGVDEQASAHHGLLADADDLAGLPVVIADLHSALPAIIAGLRQARPDVKVVYVMPDGGALPVWFSRTVAGLREAGWISCTVTVGQAFGGDLEAVTLQSGLLAARVVERADLAIVIQGPGNLGTGTRWGFSGVAAGEAINAASVLGGRPVAVLRISEADARERHVGVSHHSLTAYGRVALVPADVVVPVLDGAFGDLVREQVAVLGPPLGRHRLVSVDVDGLREALLGSPVPLSTMGRGLDDDPAAFLASAAAGRHAAALLAP